MYERMATGMERTHRARCRMPVCDAMRKQPTATGHDTTTTTTTNPN
jgi:hypothetical protein